MLGCLRVCCGQAWLPERVLLQTSVHRIMTEALERLFTYEREMGLP